MVSSERSADWLRDALDLGCEQRRVEFKPAGKSDNPWLRARVIRAVLALGNTSGGGIVVVGVNDSGGTLEPIGLTDEEFASWRADLAHDAIRPYVDPQPELLVEPVRLDGRRYVLLRVSEFAEVPLLCRKSATISGKVVLREGACYVRAVMKSESVEVSTYAQMREIMDLATEKALAKYLRTAHRAGGGVDPTGPDDDELFRKQREDLE
jgi:predicted HTH transcriptional regulator